MSHLKPHVPGTDQVKDVADYSADEKSAALMQVSDDHQKRIADGKPISKENAKLAQELARGTEKEGTLDPKVDAAAAGVSQTGNTDAPSNAASSGGTQDDERITIRRARAAATRRTNKSGGLE